MSRSPTIANCDDVAVTVAVDVEIDAPPAPSLQPSPLPAHCRPIVCVYASVPLVLHEHWQMSWAKDSAQRAPSLAMDPDSSRSRFHGRGEEMVKGAAMETVLLQQCPPDIAENFAVAVRDMSAAVLEKQHELLARASADPLELPPPLPLPNGRDFPTSRKREMTGHEAGLQEEVDSAVRRREVIEAEDEYNDRRHYNERSVEDIIKRHSQRQDLPPSCQSPSPDPPPSSPSSTTFSSSDDGENVGETGGARRPRRGVRRGVRRSRKLVENSQTREDVAASKTPKRRKPGKRALAPAAEMSQTARSILPPPSSAVLLSMQSIRTVYNIRVFTYIYNYVTVSTVVGDRDIVTARCHSRLLYVSPTNS
jgi:hypothetical protein